MMGGTYAKHDSIGNEGFEWDTHTDRRESLRKRL